MDAQSLRHRLCERAAGRYRATGRFAWHFARGKLRGDPVFGALLERGLVPDGARILDLGCGQGLLAAWLVAAADSHRDSQWCQAWPAPPASWSYRGIERSPAEVLRARAALGDAARFDAGDVCQAGLGAADVVVLLDVLHYMAFADQEDVLRRVRAALSPRGLLLLRIGDAGGGLPFRVSNWVDRVVVLLRGHGWAPLYCRPLQAWLDLLAKLGFNTISMPMSADTPFANTLLVARPQ